MIVPSEVDDSKKGQKSLEGGLVGGLGSSFHDLPHKKTIV